MENNKIHIEDLIREIDAEKRKGPKLDADKIIQQANWEIERRELEKRRKRTGYIATAVVLIAVITVSLTCIDWDEGYGSNIRQIFFKDSPDDRTRADNFIAGESKKDIIEKEIAVDELGSVVPFEVRLPQVIPDSFNLDKVLIRYGKDEEVVAASLLYCNFDTEDIIKYVALPIDYRMTRFEAIDIDAGDMKEKTANNITYTYSDNEKGNYNIILWETDQICYSLYGNERIEVLLDMAISVNEGE